MPELRLRPYHIRDEVVYLIVALLFFVSACLIIDLSFIMSLFFIWNALVFFAISIAYLMRWNGISMKSKYGKIDFVNRILLFPYYLFNELFFLYQRTKKEQSPAWQKISGELYIGRFGVYGDIPEKIQSIIDLTNEFSASPGERLYYSIPMLDGSVPSRSEYDHLHYVLKNCPEPVFIHCAEGHGRTLLVAALFLVLRGDCHYANNALNEICKIRPRCRLTLRQQQYFTEITRELCDE